MKNQRYVEAINGKEYIQFEGSNGKTYYKHPFKELYFRFSRAAGGRMFRVSKKECLGETK